MKVVYIFIVVILVVYLVACGASSNDKEVEQLRKETELAKKEAELAKKELELSKAQPSPSPEPTKPSTVTVSLRLLTQGALHYSPMEGLTVLIETQGRVFKGRTNAKGWATFGEIPCGQAIRVSAPDYKLQNDKDWKLVRNLQCDRPKVVIGSFGDLVGQMLTKDDMNYILQ